MAKDRYDKYYHDSEGGHVSASMEKRLPDYIKSALGGGKPAAAIKPKARARIMEPAE
jgi:hypothetical protein